MIFDTFLKTYIGTLFTLCALSISTEFDHLNKRITDIQNDYTDFKNKQNEYTYFKNKQNEYNIKSI